MAPPKTAVLSNLTRSQKLLFGFAFLYFMYKLAKFLKKLREISKPLHKELQNPYAIQVPPAYLFPQFFLNQSGLWIFHRDWILPQDVQMETPKGIVVICHGLAEHIQRYEHLARALNQQGFAVYGIDHQGHGMSAGDRTHVQKFNDFVEDFLTFCTRIKEEYPDLPRFLLGHSMGGLIAARVACKEPDLFNGGVILSSPFFAPSPHIKPDSTNPIMRWIILRLSDYFPKLRIVEIDRMALSHSPSIFYRSEGDPLHYTGKPTIRLCAEVALSAEDILLKAEQVKYPFLLIGGADDKICNPTMWRMFYNRVSTPKPLKEIHVFPGLYHECLNETEVQQKQVFDKILEWMLKRCRPEIVC